MRILYTVFFFLSLGANLISQDSLHQTFNALITIESSSGFEPSYRIVGNVNNPSGKFLPTAQSITEGMFITAEYAQGINRFTASFEIDSVVSVVGSRVTLDLTNRSGKPVYSFPVGTHGIGGRAGVFIAVTTAEPQEERVSKINDVFYRLRNSLDTFYINKNLDTTIICYSFIKNDSVLCDTLLDVSLHPLLKDTVTISGFVPTLYAPLHYNGADFELADTSKLASVLIVDILDATTVVITHEGTYENIFSIPSGIYFLGATIGVATTTIFDRNKQFLYEVYGNRIHIDIGDIILNTN